MKNEKGSLEGMMTTALIFDRLAFCSKSCVVNALEYGADLLKDRQIKSQRIGPALARVISCYGCDLHLDEAEG